MASIEKTSQEWVKAGIISNEQATAIVAFEKSGKSKIPYAVYSVTILGALVVSLGIISFVASNWEYIPAVVKLLVDFAILAGLGYFFVTTDPEKRPLLYETLIAFFMAMILASIGLIGQIFHLGGKLYEAILFWAAICLPIAAYTRNYFIALSWLSLLLIALGFEVETNGRFEFLLGKNNRWMGYGYSVPFLCGTVLILLKQFKSSEVFQRAFSYALIVSGILGAFAADTLGSSKSFHSHDAFGWENHHLYFGDALFTLLFALAFMIKYLPDGKRLLIFAVMGLYALLFHLTAFGVPYAIVYGVVALTLYSATAILVATWDHKKLFNQMMMVVGLRFVGLYLQALGGLAMTGFGLITAGGLILFGVRMWSKKREQIDLMIARYLK